MVGGPSMNIICPFFSDSIRLCKSNFSEYSRISLSIFLHQILLLIPSVGEMYYDVINLIKKRSAKNLILGILDYIYESKNLIIG